MHKHGAQDVSQIYMIIKLLFNFDLSECPINHFFLRFVARDCAAIRVLMAKKSK